MTIQFECTCGRPLEVLDEMAGHPYRCKGCGNQILVPGGEAPAVSSPPYDGSITDAIRHSIPARQKRPCPKCGESLGPRAKICFKCGWDIERGVRTCMFCERDLRLDHDPGVGYEFEGAFIGTTGLIILKLFGVWGAVAAGCGLAALGSLISAVVLSWKCKVCHRKADTRTLSKEEVDEIQKKRILFIAFAIVLGLLSFGFASSWLWAARAAVTR